MIVFRRHYDESIATFDCRLKLWILHLLACVIEFHWQLAHIDQFRLHIRTFLRLLKNETPDVLALSSLTRSAKNHWNEKRTRVHISNFPFCANRSFCSFRNPRPEIESADGRTRTGTGLLRPNGF